MGLSVSIDTARAVGKPEPMGGTRKTQQKILNKSKTRRGVGKKDKNRKYRNINFSIFGSNANGLKGKAESLKSAINFYNFPSCITIQESKLRSEKFEIPGYQVFLKNRSGMGGGLLTAIDEN